MFKLDSCPVCNSNSFKKDLTCKDHTVSKEDFTLSVCLNCGFKFTNPRPENKKLGFYYKSDDYISHTNTTKGLISKLYHRVRNYTLKGKLNLLSKYVSRGTVLDYGCGTGMFLNICKMNGWEPLGVEPDEGARKIALGMGLNVLSSKEKLDNNISEKKIDAITLWHVLEHLTDLHAVLHFFNERLSEHGVLIIAVPNYKSFDAQHYKEFWAGYDVPRHLYHFDQKTINQLLGEFNFQLVETRPMRFDSFYVSMLSEKYKSGTINYFKAFINGLKSNIKARSRGEYSSLIYIFRHK